MEPWISVDQCQSFAFSGYGLLEAYSCARWDRRTVRSAPHSDHVAARREMFNACAWYFPNVLALFRTAIFFF